MSGYDMTFGKWRGQQITQVPSRALRYYLEWPGLQDDQLVAISAELAARDLEAESVPRLSVSSRRRTGPRDGG